jgi:hypothetical protein
MLAVAVVAPTVPVIVRVAVISIGPITRAEPRDQGYKKKCAQPFYFHDDLLIVISALLTPKEKQETYQYP